MDGWMDKTIKLSRLIFATVTILSQIYYICEKLAGCRLNNMA
jgi:hypothetical protein